LWPTEVVVGAFRSALVSVTLAPADREMLPSTLLGRLVDVAPDERVE